MPRMSGAKAFVEALKREGVREIFGIPGGAILPIHDELYFAREEIRHILCRHEQCAAHAADGYARASGRAGVCMATSGPGATNLVTGIANAYMDSSPVVAFTGQVPTSLVGKDAFQEADIIGITAPITKHNIQVRRPEQLPYAIKEAFYVATTGRPGPVVIDIPKDVQTSEADVEFPEEVRPPGYKVVADPHPLQIEKAVNLLLNAERPIILAGGGVRIANASDELIALAEYLLIPVATTLMGKGCIPEDHPLSMGMVGMHGTPHANKAVNEADVILAVGTRFADRTTGAVSEFARSAKIIHIDIDPSEIGKNVEAHVPIVADAKRALRAMLDRAAQSVAKREDSLWYRRLREAREEFRQRWSSEAPSGEPIKPPRLMKILRELLPRDAIVTTEVGQNQMWAALYFETYSPKNFISSGGLGTMGFGFPAAIGAKVAKPEVPVVDIAGDGSFIMTEQDLATSVEEDIPVIVVVLDNRVLGMVAQWQRLFYGRRYSNVMLGKVPDFVKLAEAYGAMGLRAESYEEFRAAMREALSSEATAVIEVPISPEENVFPMVPPGKGLGAIILGGD